MMLLGLPPVGVHPQIWSFAATLIRATIYAEIKELEEEYRIPVLNTGESNILTLLGKVPNNAQPELVYKLLKIVAVNVHKMYCILIRNREGIG